jgi:hypothetical protein
VNVACPPFNFQPVFATIQRKTVAARLAPLVECERRHHAGGALADGQMWSGNA